MPSPKQPFEQMRLQEHRIRNDLQAFRLGLRIYEIQFAAGLRQAAEAMLTYLEAVRWELLEEYGTLIEMSDLSPPDPKMVLEPPTYVRNGLFRSTNSWFQQDEFEGEEEPWTSEKETEDTARLADEKTSLRASR